MAVTLNIRGTSVSSFRIGKQGPILNNNAGDLEITNATNVKLFGGTAEQVRITETSSAVNYIELTGSITTNNPTISSKGTDSNIGLEFITKGTDDVVFKSTSGSRTMLEVQAVTSSVNYPIIKPSATGNAVSIEAAGSDTNIDIQLTPKGTGDVFLGSTISAANSLQGENDQDFFIKSGDSVAADAGDLILEGGDGSGSFSDGDVIIRPGAGAATPTGQVCIQDDTLENIACFVGTTGTDVNYLTFTSAITTANPVIAATGADTNIDIKLEPKGTGAVILGSAEATTASIQAEDDQDLYVKGGDSAAADAGDLVLEGGDGTGSFSSGDVVIRGGAGGPASGTITLDSGVEVGTPTGGNKGDGSINAGSLYIDGNVLPTVLSGSAALDFGSIDSLGQEDLTITVTGTVVGDEVSLGLPAAPTSGIIFNAFVSASNTVTVRAHNYTAGAIDPDSATYNVKVFQ